MSGACNLRYPQPISQLSLLPEALLGSRAGSYSPVVDFSLQLLNLTYIAHSHKSTINVTVFKPLNLRY